MTLSTMDSFVNPKELKHMIYQGRTHPQISETLQARFPHITRGLSVRNVRRFCSEYSIHRPSGAELNNVVENAVSEVC